MKLTIRTAFLLLLLIPVTHCATTGQKEGIKAASEPGNSSPNENDILIREDWSLYSYGLHYKQYAIENPQDPKRTEYLTKALEYFQEAQASERALDRVWSQISDCYFYLYNFPAALEYARKAIDLNPSFQEPYNRTYNIYMRLKNEGKAAEILEEYCRANPGDIHILFLLGEHYLKSMSDRDNAGRIFRKVIELSNNSANENYYREYSYYYLGYLAFYNNDYEKALAYYREVYVINNTNDKALYMLAILYMLRYDLDNAQEFALQYLAMVPDNSAMNGIMGRSLYLRDDVRAIHYLRKAIDGRTVEGFQAQGLLLEMRQKDDEAANVLTAIIKNRPRAITPHIAMAHIYRRAGDTRSEFNELISAGIISYQSGLMSVARECFTRAVEIDDSVAEAFYYLGRIYEENEDYSMALVRYRRVNEINPDTDMLLHMGYLYGLQKNYDMAFQHFEMASRREPVNPKPYFYKGLVFLWVKDYTFAEENMLKAIELDDGSETYYFYLAVIQEKNKKLNEAISSLEKAHEKNPESARVNNYLGYLYADNDMKIDRSLELIQKALLAEPDNGAYLDSLGWAYYRQGNYPLALEKLLMAEKQLDKTSSPDPVVYDHIGDTYFKIGDADRAVFYWKKSLKLDDNRKVRGKLSGVLKK